MSADKSGLLEEALTERVIGGFFAVYGELGFGFLESVHENALFVELRRSGLQVVQQPPVEMHCVGHAIAQLLNYLRVTGLPLGLLIDFGPRAQFRRKINTRR